LSSRPDRGVPPARRGATAWRIAVTVPGLFREPFTAALESFADAVSFSEPDSRGQSRIEATTAANPDPALVGAALALVAASLKIAEPEAAIERLSEQEWVAAWNMALAPLRIGRFFIHNSEFRGRPAAGCLVLSIDSGGAFGTGRHESTQGCLLALAALAKSRRVKSALDLGCGGGILALAAARLWPARVLACDNDPESVAVARAAVRRNGMRARVQVVPAEGPSRRIVMRRAPFDLIAANILAPPLMAMARGLSRSMAPGGAIVLAGFLDKESMAVERRYRNLGLGLVARIGIGPWRTLVLERPGRGGGRQGLCRGNRAPSFEGP
jgi:ribosomal protein L11 methyltransferase